MSDHSTAVEAAEDVLIDVTDGIKTITINRPKRKNALNDNAYKIILAAVTDSDQNDDIRVTILTGAAGDFSAGADLAPSTGDRGAGVTERLKNDIHPIISSIRASDKPFIAKVRGNCVGVGCNIALCCDMIFAAEGARFSQIFVRVGLSTDGGGSYFMPNAMGYPKAYENCVLGNLIPAEEAERLNLINRVVKGEELDDLVADIASRLATGPFLAIKNTKSNLRVGSVGTLQEALDHEAENQGINFKSADFAEGAAAFIQKRKPNYQGR